MYTVNKALKKYWLLLCSPCLRWHWQRWYTHIANKKHFALLFSVFKTFQGRVFLIKRGWTILWHYLCKGSKKWNVKILIIVSLKKYISPVTFYKKRTTTCWRWDWCLFVCNCGVGPPLFSDGWSKIIICICICIELQYTVYIYKPPHWH